MITSDPSVVERAIDSGVVYFDTARVYQNGNNERMVGAAIRGKRDRLILSTKSQARRAREALADLEISLKTLGTDHVDIWYMHSVDDPKEITDGMLAAWETAKKQGKIRHIGISTHFPNLVADRIVQAGKFEVVLSTYNFTIGAASDAAFAKLSNAGIGLVAMKVMAPAARQYGFKADRSGRMERPGGPLAALKWVLRNPRFATAIPSMVDMDQLETNLRALTEPFSAEDARILARLDEEVRPLYCRMCNQCSGQCPRGVRVPETLRYLAYADFYGQYALGRGEFLKLPPEARQARCADCASCVVRCPNGVRVAERLAKAQAWFA
jgi:predicted aldo/keto reductase-like oxidoreductase